MTTISTTRFGPIEIEDGDVLHFPDGLLGLPSCREWVLLADEENDALAWLQSVDRPEIALGVVSPRRFVPSYRMRVAQRELEPLRLPHTGAARVLIVVSKTERSVTLNLKAPLVINLNRRLGRQVVTNGDLPVQYVLGSASPALRRSA
jgi:flagellar assembly factor FliW